MVSRNRPQIKSLSCEGHEIFSICVKLINSIEGTKVFSDRPLFVRVIREKNDGTVLPLKVRCLIL